MARQVLLLCRVVAACTIPKSCRRAERGLLLRWMNPGGNMETTMMMLMHLKGPHRRRQRGCPNQGLRCCCHKQKQQQFSQKHCPDRRLTHYYFLEEKLRRSRIVVVVGVVGEKATTNSNLLNLGLMQPIRYYLDRTYAPKVVL